MPKDQQPESCYVLIDEVHYVERQALRRRRFEPTEEIVDPWSYQAKRGLGTLRLSVVEFRILSFLASRPNQALTHRRIAEAVSTYRHPVTVESLARHIHTLRDQLGFFSDYIQSVPYIGYRFKA